VVVCDVTKRCRLLVKITQGASCNRSVSTYTLFVRIIADRSSLARLFFIRRGPCSLSHNAFLDLMPVHSIWDLWWPKLHWDRFFSEFFGFFFVPPISFHRRSTSTVQLLVTKGTKQLRRVMGSIEIMRYIAPRPR
jgi:hypothetical protein